MVGTIVVDGALTCCALLHCMCGFQTTQINMQQSNLRTYALHNAMEAAKNICCEKGEGIVDHSTVT